MFKFLKKDSLLLGIALGAILPGLLFLIIYLINTYVPNPETGESVFRISTVSILSIVPNAVLLRYYLVSLKADKTGRGILLVTFVFAIVFMIFYYL